jgi:hypothetical protein
MQDKTAIAFYSRKLNSAKKDTPPVIVSFNLLLKHAKNIVSGLDLQWFENARRSFTQDLAIG